MKDRMSVELRGLHFYAYHGLYNEEKKTGNEFIVEVLAEYVPPSGTVTGLEDTVDYGSLYSLVEEEMKKPRHLLETLAMEIAELAHHRFPILKKIQISITKMQVPVAKFIGNASITYIKEF